MCRCWPGHRKFGELHVGQVDRTTHHQQSRGQLTRASRGELQRAQRLAGVESGGVYVSLLARTSEVELHVRQDSGMMRLVRARRSLTGGDGARGAALAGGGA